MGGILTFTNGFLDAVNAVNSAWDKQTQKEAEFETSIKQIRLQNDINGELLRMRQSGNFNQWNDNVSDFFERIKSGMSNPDSPYYCKNQIQADYFNKILAENNTRMSYQVAQMSQKYQIEKMGVEKDNAKQILLNNGVTGQEYADEADKLDDDYADNGGMSPLALGNAKRNNQYVGYTTAINKLYEENVDEAIKRGEDVEALWNRIEAAAPKMKNMDGTFNQAEVNRELKKDITQRYNAKLEQLHRDTEKYFVENYWDRIQDTSDIETRNQIKKQARNELDNYKGTNKMSPEQFQKWTNLLKLEDSLDPTGNTTKGQASSAANKLNPDDVVNFYMNAIKNGDQTTVYNAWNDFLDDMLDEYREYTKNPDATIVDVEKAYPKVGKFLEYAENNLPPGFNDVIKAAENALKAGMNKGDNEEEISSTLALVKDLLFDARLKGVGNQELKDIKTRAIRAINAKLGGVLEKQKKYKDAFKDYAGIETLSNYKTGVGDKEHRMAKAMRERDANPDLVYTQPNGVVVPFALSEGLSRLENDERSELKALIKSRTGKEVSDKDIKMDYARDENAGHDVTAQRIYTIDGMDYRFSSKDGRHITLEQKENGTNDWEETKTVLQQEKYDTSVSTANRTMNGKDTSQIPKGGFTYYDNGKKKKMTYTDPEGEEKEITQSYWKHLSFWAKQDIIKRFLEENPDEAQEWIKSLPDKRKHN